MQVYVLGELEFQSSHDFAVMDSALKRLNVFTQIPFQSSHDFAVMDRAGKFRPLLIATK